jgi:hypothetical protein
MNVESEESSVEGQTLMAVGFQLLDGRSTHRRSRSCCAHSVVSDPIQKGIDGQNSGE